MVGQELCGTAARGGSSAGVRVRCRREAVAGTWRRESGDVQLAGRAGESRGAGGTRAARSACGDYDGSQSSPSPHASLALLPGCKPTRRSRRAWRQVPRQKRQEAAGWRGDGEAGPGSGGRRPAKLSDGVGRRPGIAREARRLAVEVLLVDVDRVVLLDAGLPRRPQPLHGLPQRLQRLRAALGLRALLAPLAEACERLLCAGQRGAAQQRARRRGSAGRARACDCVDGARRTARADCGQPLGPQRFPHRRQRQSPPASRPPRACSRGRSRWRPPWRRTTR